MSLTTDSVHIADTNNGRKPKRRVRFLDVLNSVVKAATKKTGARSLEMHDGSTAKTPFKHDGAALADLRPDQVPRFFGALTDPHTLEDREINLDDLQAMQNRVDPNKVQAIRGNPDAKGKPAVVVRYGGTNYIADGHHRLTAAWLDGADKAKVKFKDIGRRSNAMKFNDALAKGGQPVQQFEMVMTVSKAQDDQNLVFGWASVVEEDGKPVEDTQGDVISEPELEKAFYHFAENARMADEMHDQSEAGPLVECMVFTKEKQKLLGIDLKKVGAWVGFRLKPEVYAKVKSGEYKAFSIGGSGIRLPLE